MSKVKKDTIEAKGFEDFRNNYISITDIARYKICMNRKMLLKIG